MSKLMSTEHLPELAAIAAAIGTAVGSVCTYGIQKIKDRSDTLSQAFLRIDALQRRVDEVNKQLDAWQETARSYHSENEILKAENTRLRIENDRFRSRFSYEWRDYEF